MDALVVDNLTQQDAQREGLAMAEIVWFFDELYVPQEVDFGTFTVTPIHARDSLLPMAIRAYLAMEGEPFAVDDEKVPQVDVAALVFRNIDAADLESAFEMTSMEARAIGAALGLRQLGRGRLIGAVARGEAWMAARRLEFNYPRVTNLPFVPETQEIAAILRTFADHPESLFLAESFAEACRDRNPSAAVVRLWAVLEALAERLRGSKLDKVRAMLKRLQIAEPQSDGAGLVQRAYDVRNDFMHHGRQLGLPDGAQLRMELIDLVAFVLRHSGMVPLAPIPRRGAA